MLLILILPLISAIILGFFGRFIGYKGSMIFSCILLGLTTFLSIKAFFNIGILSNAFLLNLNT